MFLHIISKADARHRDLKHYFTGIACKRGGIGLRRASDGACICQLCVLASRERACRWQADNPERANARKKTWADSNREKTRASSSKWRQEHQAQNSEIQSAYYQANKDSILSKGKQWRAQNRQLMNKYARRWRVSNADKVRHLKTRRKSAQLQRTPAWLTKEHWAAIAAVYREASQRRQAGESVHVDHIVPLRGGLVSGLHVPWNLTIISSSENQKKSNKFIP